MALHSDRTDEHFFTMIFAVPKENSQECSIVTCCLVFDRSFISNFNRTSFFSNFFLVQDGRNATSAADVGADAKRRHRQKA
jgi:hypothetical protein